MVIVYYFIVWERGKKYIVNCDSLGRGVVDRFDSIVVWNILIYVWKKESYKNLK